MESLPHLFENNRAWSARLLQEDPAFFRNLCAQQKPEFLWIGCSDSRIPPNEITGLLPGELFVHRNIANVVVHTDLNCLSVLQFAVDVLKVKHVIVGGHYGCSGVQAALGRERLGLVDNWLRHVQDVHRRHRDALDRRTDPRDRYDRLCELNVIEQVQHVSETSVLQDAWARGQDVCLHGWIYEIQDGLLTDLGMTVDAAEAVKGHYEGALERILGIEAGSSPDRAHDPTAT